MSMNLTVISVKPKIREDGTVDYWSMNLIEVVREGQEIAKYHPAVEAKAGVDVKEDLSPENTAENFLL